MIDIFKHTRRIFPWMFQTEINLNLVDTIINTCFDRVNARFDELKTKTTQKLGYSSQKLSLEESLNDNFDSTQRRIYIENGGVVDAGYFYDEAETIDPSQELYIFNESESNTEEFYIYNENESLGSASSGATVFVPSELQPSEVYIVEWIERVKYIGVFYNISYF